jgi:hypothetical protein
MSKLILIILRQINLKHYKDENDKFRFYTVPLTMLAGAVAAFAIGLGFFRRYMELLTEAG